jgi:glycosyltransferase involved in cell wall biosynthesis
VTWPVPAATLLFTHNVESRISARHATFARDLRSRVLWTWQNLLMSRYEARMARRFDRVVAVSESDRAEFEQRFGLENVRAIPTGVDPEEFAPRSDPAEQDHVVFCGSMDWSPNQDAVAWFLAEAWPEIRRRRPAARFSIVGRNPPPDLEALVAATPGATLTGRVDDVRPWLARAACVVVPLRIGGGTRIKIYEALAMARPVVSTPVGAEGLPLAPGEHYVAAETGEAFGAGVAECLSDPGRAERMGERGRAFVASRFGWSAVADVFAAIGAEAVEARSGRR